MKRRQRAVVWVEMGVAVLAVAAGCQSGGGFLCAGGDCQWSSTDVARVEALADLPSTAPPDLSNHYAADPSAAALGKMLYFDTRFSGPSTMLDALNRKM